MISSEVWRFSKILPGIKGGEVRAFVNAGGRFDILEHYPVYSYRMNFKSGASFCYIWEHEGTYILKLMTEDKQLTNNVVFKVQST